MTTNTEERIIRVRPKQIVEYEAVQWNGDAQDPAVRSLAERHGWVAEPSPFAPGAMRLVRARKTLTLHRKGAWVVAHGYSVRVVTPRAFKETYQEVPPA